MGAHENMCSCVAVSRLLQREKQRAACVKLFQASQNIRNKKNVWEFHLRRRRRALCVALSLISCSQHVQGSVWEAALDILAENRALMSPFQVELRCRVFQTLSVAFLFMLESVASNRFIDFIDCLKEIVSVLKRATKTNQ